MVTVVITSFNRFDLLERAIKSFNRFNSYPIREIIIIEDSADKEMHEKLTSNYSKTCRLILNEENIGAYASIDNAYSVVTTPWVLHFEDDWEFVRGGFVKQAVEILEHDKMIMQVNLEHDPSVPPLPEVYSINDVKYQILGEDINGYWHGFTCHPSVRSMAGYEKTKPWTQWSTEEDFLALREMKVGKEYFRLGYKAAILEKSYCYHTGIGRCTWNKNE